MKIHLLKLFLNEFRKRKKKTSLITFAIAWGALSLLLMMAFGSGLSNQFRLSFSGLGEDLIMVHGGQTSMDYEGLPKGRNISIYKEDVKLIQDQIPGIKRISPETMSNSVITYKGKETNRNLRGVHADYGYIRSAIAQQGGRFINPDDVKYSRRVAFMGWNLKQELFGNENAIGKTITIDRMPFKIIGILKKKLQSSNYNGLEYDQIFVPLSTLSLIHSQRSIDFIHLQPVNRNDSTFISKRIKEILGKKYRFNTQDDYALHVEDTIEVGGIAAKVFMGIEIFLGLIGGLTLLIGAVGVTNLMYAIVKERTREIGIKMAMGSKRRHIVYQFLLEAAMIFFKGTFWGSLVAFNIVGLVRLIPLGYDISSFQSYLIRPQFSMDTLLLFITTMGIMVFLSGIFPALRASKLNPVESLRYE